MLATMILVFSVTATAQDNLAADAWTYDDACQERIESYSQGAELTKEEAEKLDAICFDLEMMETLLQSDNAYVPDPEPQAAYAQCVEWCNVGKAACRASESSFGVNLRCDTAHAACLVGCAVPWW